MIHINLKFFELFICCMNIWNAAADEPYNKHATIRLGRYVASTRSGFRKLEA